MNIVSSLAFQVKIRGVIDHLCRPALSAASSMPVSLLAFLLSLLPPRCPSATCCRYSQTPGSYQSMVCSEHYDVHCCVARYMILRSRWDVAAAAWRMYCTSTLGQAKHRLPSPQAVPAAARGACLLGCSRQHLHSICMRLPAAAAAAATNRLLPTAKLPSILSAGMVCHGAPCGAAHIRDWAAATAASLVMPNSL